MHNKGFTLIEILLAISIVGVILMSINQFCLGLNSFWNYNQTRVDLLNQGRVIAYYLDDALKKTIDCKVMDTDEDGDSEILLNLGDKGGEGDRTDENTDYYLLFNVRDNKLTLRKTKASFNNSGVKFPDWPEETDWGYNRSITINIIDDYLFTNNYHEQHLLYYRFRLKLKDQQYQVSSTYFPSIYSNRRYRN